MRKRHPRGKALAGAVALEAALLALTMCSRQAPDPKRACRDLDLAIDSAFKVRECKTDDDCTMKGSYCSCQMPVAKAAVSRIEALNAEWAAKGCATQEAPRACPTCPMFPPPVCAGGLCSSEP